MTDFTKELGALDETNKIIEKSIVNTSEISEGSRAEIDVAVSTARKFPRDLVQSLKNILFLATQDKETADSCFYSVVKDGKTIRGASIRLAEIITSCYGNIRSSSSIISNDGKSITARGICWDLQNNVAYSVEVIRKITDASGRTISEDMQILESMAASSIALRNAIFKVVPAAITQRIQNEIKKIVMGESADFETIKNDTINHFIKKDVPEKNILAMFDKKTIEELTREDIFDLRGIITAIKEGDTTIQSAFSMAKSNNAIGKATKQLGDLPPMTNASTISEKTINSGMHNATSEIAITIEPETEEQQASPTDLGKAIENRKKNSLK